MLNTHSIISGFSAKLSLNTEIILVILALFSPQRLNRDPGRNF